MSSPARPALAEVLATLLDVNKCEEQPAFWLSLPYASVRVGRFRLTERSTGPEFDGVRFFAPRSNESGAVPRDVRRAWRHTSPAEALEALATAGLWPWSTPDDGPRWWCEACGCSGSVTPRGGRGGQMIYGVRCDCASRPTTGDERDLTGEEYVSDLRTPPSHAALVAVASLGAPLLARCVHLADVIAGAAGFPDARVVWRVMGREAIDDVHRSNAGTLRGVAGTFGNEATITDATTLTNVALTPWPVTPPRYDDASIAAWPARRSLAVGDDETPRPTGLHLLALDPQRVVIGVEAIGGER